MASGDGIDIRIKGQQIQDMRDTMAGNYATLQTSSTSATAGITFTVPTGYSWLMQSLYATITTTAATGARSIRVEAQTSTGGVVAQYRPIPTFDASATGIFMMSPEVADRAAATGTVYVTTPIDRLELPAGYLVKVTEVGTGTATGDPLKAHLLVLQRPTL